MGSLCAFSYLLSKGYLVLWRGGNHPQQSLLHLLDLTLSKEDFRLLALYCFEHVTIGCSPIYGQQVMLPASVLGT